jgi:hypothetical protein
MGTCSRGRVLVVLLMLGGSTRPLTAQVRCGSFSFPPPLSSAVHDMIEFGGTVYVAGDFTGAASGSYITRFDGQSYSPLPSPLPARATSLAVYDDGTGPALYVGGSQWTFNFGIVRYGVLKWTGTSWESTGYPQDNLGDGITDMVVYDDGEGPELYAGTSSGMKLRRYNGAGWSLVPGNPWNALAMAVYDDGGGPALYVGGQFLTAGGQSVRNIAKFRNGSWSDVGGGLTMNNNPQGIVSAMETLDLGDGPRLFAGGEFNRAGTTPAFAITSWDGSGWRRYPFTGFQQFSFTAGGAIRSLAAATDRTPPLLLMSALNFSTFPDGEVRGGLLTWDGERWQGVGAPLEFSANAVLVRESAAGSRVFVGGQLPNNLVEWVPATHCYANCDCSTDSPRLNVADFSCFLQRFAEGKRWANCDASTAAPVVNVADFTCFLQRYAAGCP